MPHALAINLFNHAIIICVPSIVLGAGIIAVNKTDKVPDLMQEETKGACSEINNK